MTTQHILLTGVTGLVGSHVLFELLNKKFEGSDIGKIYLTIRPNERCARDRLMDILNPELMPHFLYDISIEKMLGAIEIIEADITDGNLCEAFGGLPENLTVIHSAALTNLSNKDKDRERIMHNNYKGTMNLLNAVMPFCKKFVFISTAFSCGLVEGVVDNGYLAKAADNKKQRNHYEDLKITVEQEISSLCQQKNIAWQILRPSMISGRLLEQPKFKTTKFDVFYAFANFFYRLNKKGINAPVRIAINQQSGLNLIPVDYVAKAIVESYDTDISELNIVLSKNFNNRLLISTILKNVGYDQYTFVDDTPADLNPVEQMYYKALGAAFSPYLTSPVHRFDTRKLRRLLHDVKEPDMTRELDGLLDYAKARDFIA